MNVVKIMYSHMCKIPVVYHFKNIEEISLCIACVVNIKQFLPESIDEFSREPLKEGQPDPPMAVGALVQVLIN